LECELYLKRYQSLLANLIKSRQVGLFSFERAAHPRELGFALLLAPNAVASLPSLLTKAYIEFGYPPAVD
jgi:hypothetical protein